MLRKISVVLALVGAGAAFSNAQDWNSPERLSLNKERPHAWFFSFQDVQSARNFLPDYSDFCRSLDGVRAFHRSLDPERRSKDYPVKGKWYATIFAKPQPRVRNLGAARGNILLIWHCVILISIISVRILREREQPSYVSWISGDVPFFYESSREGLYTRIRTVVSAAVFKGCCPAERDEDYLSFFCHRLRRAFQVSRI